ncbi:hypothetical protein [Streptomyces sp. NPDC048188]|uniref:hypothetical protein n=1 Tax=Streptomyces sp. NPDC048188 TaxID=3155749 RepID=UPI0034266E23
MTGPACGNNPHHQLSEGDRQAVENFNAYLADRATRRKQYGDVIRRWGLLDEVNDPKATEDFVVTDLLSLVDAEQAAEVTRLRGELAKALERTAVQRCADRAAVLREAADTVGNDDTCDCGGCDSCVPNARAAELRRMADEAQPAQAPAIDLPTLAAALDGLHTLIATSSRDWQTYRVDAWIWAVLCGWDCEQTAHDDTCTHGALEETAAMHGWDDATVAKARRYRTAVRTLVEAHQPAAEARQDGAQR